MVEWLDDEPEVMKKLSELEDRIDEMWERMKQFEAIMTTAFNLHMENNLNRCT